MKYVVGFLFKFLFSKHVFEKQYMIKHEVLILWLKSLNKK